MPKPQPHAAHPTAIHFDLRQPLSRRHALHLLGGVAGAALVAGCAGGGADAIDTGTGSSSGGGSSSSSGGSSSGGSSGSCTRVAEETAGPFPANGTNTSGGVTKNVLTDARAFRTDIRSDLDGSNTQTGIPLTVTLTLLNVNGSCGPLAGYYVYLWHCSRLGSYSQYSGTMNGGDYSERTWLRGVAQTDANGRVSFTTIFPGRYSGRATHMHYQVYPDATPANGEQRATSQLAFPASVTDGAGSPYANTTLYPTSASNNTSNERDNVFSNGTSTEMLTITGNNTDGYVATITVGISA